MLKHMPGRTWDSFLTLIPFVSRPSILLETIYILDYLLVSLCGRHGHSILCQDDCTYLAIQ